MDDPATRNDPDLHEAVRGGRLEAFRRLLETQGVAVDGVDVAGNTPLLLAVCIEEEEVYDEVVEELIRYGADVNFSNKGFTLLYNAVFYKREASVGMLLRAGAWLREDTHRNEIHLLSQMGGSNILRLILNDKRCCPELVNRSDNDGNTPLHIAAQSYHKNCLKILIQHEGDLNATNNDDETVVDIIFEQFVNPEKFITGILDESVHVEQAERYKYVYNIDFGVLVPKNCGRQMEVISNMLVVATEGEKIEVLQHPLIELFLVLKWKKIAYFFYAWIFAYLLFAVSMGLFVTFLIHKEKNKIAVEVVRYVLVVCSLGLLGHAILQCMLTRRNYLRSYEMWMNLICTSLSLKVALAGDGDSGPASYVLHITSITVLLAWIELMLLIGRLPSLGHYALMFSVVLQNILKLLLAFACLLIGFALSFSIQFQHIPQFSDPWKSFVKTVVMMMGELDYGGIFDEENDGNFPLVGTSRLIFLTFIILTSTALVNLMVGVAVSDIQQLQRQGRAKKLEKQAEFLCQLEKVISSEQLNSGYVPSFIKKVFVRRSFIDTKYRMRSSTEFQRTEGISRRIIESITKLAKRRMQEGLD